jgi:alpha/beta superfamily hydrolase
LPHGCHRQFASAAWPSEIKTDATAKNAARHFFHPKLIKIANWISKTYGFFKAGRSSAGCWELFVGH